MTVKQIINSLEEIRDALDDMTPQKRHGLTDDETEGILTLLDEIENLIY